ncbi:dTDP-4-dehydrorhamnose 3,5-epimerase [Flammeovirgaceae bacterium]
MVGDLMVGRKNVMPQLKIIKNPKGIEGLAIIEPTIHDDPRGYFVETYNQKDMLSEGLDLIFVQDNQSKSSRGVLRGLHFQKQYPQGKLVRVIQGSVYDVAVDLRTGSPTYGQYYGITLTDINNLQFYIPKGFAHGFLVLSDEAVFAYKCTDFYHPNDEGGLAWDDPDIGIEWPLEQIEEIKLSEKDKLNPTLREIQASGFNFRF